MHREKDERLGTPLCGECYDYAGHVAFNWWAPELWRRFTIALRRALARRLGISVAELARVARVSFAKVAEFQRLGVVHFHALVRLDGFGNFAPPGLPVAAEGLAEAVRQAAESVRLVVPGDARPRPPVPPEPDCRHRQVDEAQTQPQLSPRSQTADERRKKEEGGHNQVADPQKASFTGRRPCPPRRSGHDEAVPQEAVLLLRFGDQVDTQVIGGGTGGELTPERVAAYPAKYATKSAEDFGLGERRLAGRALNGVGVSAHVARIVRTAWELGAADELCGLRKWLHMLGFRGHFATKSRRYSTTLGAIRRRAPTIAGASSTTPARSASTIWTTARRSSAAGSSPASVT